MKFSEEIISVFDYLGQKMGVAIDWTSSSVMPYLQELFSKYISWEIATSTIWLIIGVILLIASMICYRYFKPAYKKYTEDWTVDYCWAIFAFGLCFLILGVTMIGFQIFDIVKCKFIPELQIYEYVTNLMSNN